MIDDFISIFDSLAKKFREWKEWGTQLSDDSAMGDDYATFITDDMDVAIKAGFTLTYSGDDENEYLEIRIKIMGYKILKDWFYNVFRIFSISLLKRDFNSFWAHFDINDPSTPLYMNSIISSMVKLFSHNSDATNISFVQSVLEINFYGKERRVFLLGKRI